MLKNFEMSRSPLADFPRSNGHGRRQLARTPVSRQGNLIVESNKMVSNAELRAKLIELIKAQNKSYGLLIDDIAGGFTFTGRGQPQAFQVLPLVVYKVFADGRPDELVRGVDIVGTPLGCPYEDRRHRRHHWKFLTATAALSPALFPFPPLPPGDFDFRAGSAEERKLYGQAAHSAGSVRTTPLLPRRAVNCEIGTPVFALFIFAATIAFGATAFASAPQDQKDLAQKDNDQTLRAMHDEMERSRTRLELKIPGTDQPVRPYYVEYRLLDLDFREISGEFGTLLSSNHSRSRFMDVEARVGNYKLDSSNFISEDGFRGFIGSTGSVGIDRDYDSLRQDLWIATDQAFKEAVETYSRKQAYLSSLARQSDINDFSKAEPVHLVEPLVMADWTHRNWEQEARDTSAALRAFPQIYESRVTYYLVFATEYLVTSEGTEIRTNRSFAAIESGMNALADDGTPINHFYATYAVRPADLPTPDAVRKNLNVTGSELMALRSAPPAPDYTGPVLFEARAAAPLLAQILGPDINGARPPVSFTPVMEQLLSGLGGKSDWITRIGRTCSAGFRDGSRRSQRQGISGHSYYSVPTRSTMKACGRKK